MFMFRLLHGSHTQGQGASRKIFKRGDIIETKHDLSKMFDSPDPTSMKKFERVRPGKLRRKSASKPEPVAVLPNSDGYEVNEDDEDDDDEERTSAASRIPTSTRLEDLDEDEDEGDGDEEEENINKMPLETQKTEKVSGKNPKVKSNSTAKSPPVKPAKPVKPVKQEIKHTVTSEQLSVMSFRQLKKVAGTYDIDVEGISLKSEMLAVVENALNLG